MKPVIVWTGTDSKIDKEAFVRCTSQKEWSELWQKHRGVNSVGWKLTEAGEVAHELDHREFCPRVSFDSYMIVAIFHGKGGPEGIGVTSVLDEHDLLRVRYRIGTVQYSTKANSPPPPPRPRMPPQGYVIAVLPQSQKIVIMEQDVAPMLNVPSVWKERAKLPAVQGK